MSLIRTISATGRIRRAMPMRSRTPKSAKKLLTKALSDDELADFFNKAIVPRSNNDGSWKVNHCGVATFST